MLFYDKNGKIIQINKLDFTNDKKYYAHIMNSKCYVARNVSNGGSEEERLIRLVMNR